MYLKRDVISAIKAKVRARQGDRVEVVFMSAPAVVVEAENGERFSTKLENLSKDVIKPSVLSGQPVPKKTIQKRSKTISKTQNQLF